MSSPRSILADYARHGWHLVPIPQGKKGPTTPKWNTREMCVTEPDVAAWLDGNVGLAHAYSGTCAVDIDDLGRAAEWLQERDINLAALLDAPDAVRIVSRPGRAKLLYRVARPLPSFKCGSGALELRCASKSGLTMQDVLPPSIHPDTGEPYEWAFGSAAADWRELPPLPVNIANLWASMIRPPEDKRPAPKPREVRAQAAAPLRAALASWDPSTGYDEWLRVGMALHHETGGHDSGLALWNEWSSASPKYQGIGDLEGHWRSFKLDHDNPVTFASLRKNEVAAAEEFPDLDAEGAPTIQGGPIALLPPGMRREMAMETMRSLTRTRLGTIEARISNVAAVLGLPDICGYELAYDAYLDAVVLAPAGTEDWRPLTDSDYTNLRCWLETVGNCEPIGHDMIRQAVLLVAEQQRTDSAQRWLGSLEWDGRPRVLQFLPRYFGTEDSPYTRAVSMYLWTALAGRVLDPGCQADMVPVLIGRQGVGKSRGVQAIAPSADQFAELRIDEADDVIARKMRGILIGEMAEMRGLRAAEVERVKAFITRTHERWVPKYREFATNYPRRFMLIGTTNDDEFLPADDEHRRWLPLHTTHVRVADIHRDRDLLWAEGAQLWARDGIAWRGIDMLANPARHAAVSEDIWAEPIAQFIRDNPDVEHYRIPDLLTHAVGIDPRVATKQHEHRVGRILRSMGYEKKVVRIGNRTPKVWVFDPTS